MRIVRDLRCVASFVLGTYGRAVVGVAELLAPPAAAVAAGPAARRLSAVPDAVLQPATRAEPPAAVDAADADLATLRRAALDATLGAVVDPARGAADRFADRVTGVSEWTAGRLLADTERLRRAAVEVSRSISEPDGTLHQRRFATALRREFPWLTDDAAYALWDHAVLLTHRGGDADGRPAVALVVPADDQRAGVGGLLRRLVGRD